MSSTPLATRTGIHAILLRRRLAQGTALAGLLTGASAVALPVPVVTPVLPVPVGGTVQAEGIANISTDTSVTNPKMTVDLLTPTGRTVIDWKSFDIGATETVHFQDARAIPGAAAVLNRVVGPNGDFTGATQSQIRGTLSSGSNVSVYLVNPQGILFGAKSTVNVGSLIASTLPIDPASFRAGDSRIFNGASTEAIEISGEATLTAMGARGVIALVGARIESAGTLTAAGEVALVAASDATINFDPASPLGITIREGSPLTSPMVVGGTVNGSSILIAGATHDDVVASVLDVQSTLTATSAFATDQGIVLVAGRTALLPETVAMPVATAAAAPPAGNGGALTLQLGGTLATKAGASVAAGPIDIRAADGIRVATGGVPATLSGNGPIVVQADRGDIRLGGIGGTTVSVTGSGDVRAADIDAGGAIAIAGAAVTLDRVATTGGTLTATAATGDLSMTSAASQDAMTLRAEGRVGISGIADSGEGGLSATGGTIAIGAAIAGTTLELRSETGTVRIGGASRASGFATITGATDVAIDTLDAAAIAVTAPDALTANRLTATQASTTEMEAVLMATTGTMSVGRASATIGGVRLTTQTGAAMVGTIDAGTDGVLASAARATLTGGSTVGRDLIVTGAEVRLGGTAAAVQQAGRTASYTATAGTIAGVGATTGLTIRGDAGGTGGGSVLLDAATGIDLTGIALATGDPDGMVNSGDIGIRLTGAAAPLTLGTIVARSLLSIDSEHMALASLGVAGPVTLGATTLTNGLTLETPGAIRLDAITIGGTGQALSVTGTGPATTIEATGALSATGGVTVRAPGTVRLAGISAGTGAVTIESTGAALTAGSVTGGTVTATARNALVLGGVTATAIAGAATLTSRTAGIRVTGPTQAGGAVTIDAPGDIVLGDVRSTGATLLVQSTATAATGTLTAGAVRTATDLTIAREGGFTLGGARSDSGAVRLVSGTGTVTVTGATQAQRRIDIDGTALDLGSVRSVDEDIALRSRIGTVAAGALDARTRVSVLGETGVTLGGVTSAIGTTDIFANGGAILVTGAIDTAGRIESGTSSDATYAAVTSRGSTVVLDAGGGSLTTGAVQADGFLTLTAQRDATIASATSTADSVAIVARSGSIAVAGVAKAGTVVIADGFVDTTLGSVVAAGSDTTDLLARTGRLTVTGRTDTAGPVRLSGFAGVGVGAVTVSGDTVDVRSETGDIVTGTLSAIDVRVTAITGNARIAGLTTTTGAGSIRTGGDTVVTGDVSTGGRFDAVADGMLDLGMVTSRGDGVSLQAGTTLRAGAVSADAALIAISGMRTTANADMTLAAARSEAMGVTLRSPGTITVSGTTTARTAVDVLADGAVAMRGVESGDDQVSLISNEASVTAAAVTARQRLGIAAATDIALGSGTSTLADIGLSAGRDMAVTGALLARSNVTAEAGGAMALRDVTVSGGAMALTAGGTLTGGAIRARDGLTVLGSTDVTLDGAASDRAMVALTANAGTLRVTNLTGAEGDVTVRGGTAAALGDVTSRTGGVSLLSGAGSVRAGNVMVATLLNVTAATDLALESAMSQGGSIALAATAGTLGVSGTTRARDDVTIDARDMIRLSDVTSDAAMVTILSRAGSVGARAVLAARDIRVTGQIDRAATDDLPAQAGVSLTDATSATGSVLLTAVAGGATVTGAIRAGQDAVVDVRDAAMLGSVQTDLGAVTLSSRAGTIDAAAIDAAGSLAGIAGQDMRLTRVDTRTGGAVLQSQAGGIRIDAITTGTTLDAAAAGRLSIGSATVGMVGGQRMAAMLTGGSIEIGGIGAGSLDGRAVGGNLTLDAGDIVGAATLIKTGATGEIAIARLTAGGPTLIDSDGTVRADRLAGGATMIAARGDVTGRIASGTPGALDVDVDSLSVSAGGGVKTGTVTTRGNAVVSAGGTAVLTDRIDVAGDLTVTGGSVVLGNATRAVRQAAGGAVRMTGGSITGLAGLTLVADAGGAGDRDLTLASAGGILFQPGSTLLGGSDRQSAVRVGAGPGAAILLDTVVARTIASPGTGNMLAHDGAVTIASATTRDTLAIALTGTATPLTIGTATVAAGDLSLDTTGVLDADRLTAATGTATLAGASVRNTATSAREVTVTARTGTATFGTIDAMAGAFAAVVATDLRIARATARDAIRLTSLGGDVTGAAGDGGFGAVLLDGNSVTVRADATDGTHGLVRISMATGPNGIDLAGRTIIAETLLAATGPVAISTRRDIGGAIDQRLAIGTIDAGGTIALATGNRRGVVDGSIAIDRANSTGGDIRIDTIAGGIASRDPAVRTILTAPAGAIALDIDGAAVLGGVTAGPALAITATRLDIAAATSAGALALATRGGPLTLGTAIGGGALTIDTVGTLNAAMIDAGAVTLTSTGNATLGRVTARSGAIRVTSGAALDAGVLNGATDVTVDAASARITDVGARQGAVSLIARSGLLRVDAARAATDATLTAPTLSVGTLASGRAATLIADGDMDVGVVTAGTTFSVRAGRDAAIVTANAEDDAELSAVRRLTVGRLGTPAATTLSGRAITVTGATVGTLTATAGVDGLSLTTADVIGAAALRSDGAIAIGALAARDATLAAATLLTAERLTLGATLTADVGADLTVATIQAGGASALAAGETLTLGSVTTPAALTLAGRRIAVTRADVGQLQASAGAGGIDARGIVARDAVAIGSDADVAIGTLDAGNASLAAAAALAVDQLTTRTTLSATANTVMTVATIGAGGDVNLRGVDGVMLGTVATPAALTVTGARVAADELMAGTLNVQAGIGGAVVRIGTIGRSATVASQGGVAIGQLEAGNAAITGASDVAADMLALGDALVATAGADARFDTIRAGGDVTLSAARQLAIMTVATPAIVSLSGERIAVETLGAGAFTTAAGGGGFDLRTGRVGGAAVLATPGAIAIGTLDAGSADFDAGTDLAADTLTIGGEVAMRAGRNAAIGALTAGGAVRLATGGTQTIGRIAGRALAMLTGNAIAIGTLDADRAEIAAETDLTADRLTTADTLVATAGNATRIATVQAGGDTTLTGTRLLTLGSATTATLLTLQGDRIAVDALDTGNLAAMAGVGGLDVRTGLVAGNAAIRSDRAATIGTLSAGSVDIVAATDLVADALAIGGAVSGQAGQNLTIGVLTADGDTRLAAGRTLTATRIATPAGMTLSGAGIAVATLNAGTLSAQAGSAGIDLWTAQVAGVARIGSDAGATIGTLDASSADLGVAGLLTADLLTARTALDVTAMAANVEQTVVNAGPARFTTGVGGLTLGTVTTAGDAALATVGLLDAGAIAIGGGLTAEAASAQFAMVRVARDATLTARAGELRIGTATLGGAGTYRGRVVTVGRSTSGGVLAIDAAERIAADTLDAGGGLTVTTGALTLGTAAVRGGDAVLTSGSGQIGTITGAAGVRVAVADALAATRLDAGSGLDVRAGSATIGQAMARGGDAVVATTAGALTLGDARATGAVALTSSGASRVTGAVSAGGAYRIAAASIAFGTAGATTRQAGIDVTMVARSGAISAEGATTLAAARVLSLTADGPGGSIAFAPETVLNSTGTGILLATTGTATLGTVQAVAGEIRVAATDVALTRAVSANSVTLSNVGVAGTTRLGDSAVGNEGAFGTAGGGFVLSDGEIGLVTAPTVTIASGARDVVVGAVGLGATTGATRFAITTRGRIDMLGRFVAAGSTAARTIAIGGDGAGGRSGVLRIAATQAGGGRLLVDGAGLTLSADRIGAGLDRDFLDSIGYRTADGLSVEQVTREYVARPTSTLYAPGAFGAQPYLDGVLVQSGTLALDYGRYALFQNTAAPGQQRGVVIGPATLGSAGTGGTALRLSTTGSGANAFALFGTINGIGSAATALLGGETVLVDGTASPVASRINGCVIGSGGGCLNTSIAQPSLNLFDTSRAEIVRTADDLSLPFDPLIGTNNEALYLDTGIDAATLTDCEGDKTCPTQP